MSDLRNEILRNIKRAIVLQLWEVGAVKVNLAKPFKLTSGNYSPIYINCRQLISLPSFVDLLGAATRILCDNSSLDFDVVAGGETAGIPFAAFVAQSFGKPMIYVRKEVKSHGTSSRIEGILQTGASALLVEDLITDAGSKMGFIQAIRQAGAFVKAVVVVFDRLQGGEHALRQVGVELHSLADMDTALAVGTEAGALSSESRQTVESYLRDPRKWHESVHLPFLG